MISQYAAVVITCLEFVNVSLELEKKGTYQQIFEEKPETVTELQKIISNCRKVHFV